MAANSRTSVRGLGQEKLRDRFAFVAHERANATLTRYRRDAGMTAQRAFQAALFLAGFSSLLFAQAPTSMPQDQHALQSKDYQQFIPYWTTEGSWRSELQVRNNLRAGNLTVFPAVRSSDGTEFPLPAMVIQPQEVQSLDLTDALQTAAPQLLGAYGSIALRYHSPGLQNLYAAVMAHDMGHPVAFHLDAINEVQDYDQVSREGIWWLPRAGVQDWLILTNQSSFPMNLTLSLSDASGRTSKQKIALAPRAISRVSVRQLLGPAGLSGTYGGVKIESAAHAGSLDTVHVLFDENGGFSANLKMFDRDPKALIADRDFARTGVWTLRAPMLALEHPDPALALPSGTTLHPQIFIRNTTGNKVNATVRFNWRAENKIGRTSGLALVLRPFETRLLDVSELPPGESPPSDANWAAVTIQTSGLPDEVMAVAASYDETLRYGAQTPFSDQMTYRWEGGKWEYDRDHDSIVTAGNGGTKPIQASFAIYYDRGTKKYEIRQSLQPDDQMWIDIGELIRRQVPDQSGNVLPSGLTSGSYQFNDLTDRAVGNLFEGKVIYDKTFGHVSYGCASCCGALGTPWFSPSPVGVGLSSTAQADVLDNEGCGGYQSSVLYGFSSWSSANTSVATINQASAVVTGMGLGSAVQSSPGSITIGGFDFKKCRVGYYTPGGPANVAIPTSDPIFSANTNAAASCTTGSGWNLDVNKHVADQNGNYILTQGQTLTETFTIGPTNQLNLASIATGTGQTNAAGIVGDDYFVCSTSCPGSGQTDATQYPTDQLPGSSTSYSLKTNSVVYKCNSISVNGQTSW